jgi:hypothetical protein
MDFLASVNFVALEILTLASWATLGALGLKSETVPAWTLYAAAAAAGGITLFCLAVGIVSFGRSLHC